MNHRIDFSRKKPFLLILLGFALMEIPFTLTWIHEQGGLAGTHFHFWHQIFHDPLYQVTAIDFGTVALLAFGWMIRDAWFRGHAKLPWLWLPLFLFSPSIGLLGYLITRKERVQEQ